MGNNQIINLSDPISDNDASNKKFVYSKIWQESINAKLYVDAKLDKKI